MSSRLLPATLLLVGLAGAASAAQIKGPDVITGFAGHDGGSAELVAPAPKMDLEPWSSTEVWTFPATPEQRTSAVKPASPSDDAAHDATPASGSASSRASSDAQGTLVLGSRSAKDVNGAFLGGGSAFEQLPDGKLQQVR